MKPIESKAISASAGSGKTYALTLRFIELLYRGADPDEILCITFTRKAAKEMKERILSRLYKMAHPDPDSSEEIEEFINQLKLDLPKKEIYRHAKKIYEKLLSSSLNIMTIDAFFLFILRLFSFEAKVAFNFDVATETERRKHLQESLKLFAEKILKNSNLKEFLFETAHATDTSGNILQFMLRRIVPLLEISAELEEIQGDRELKPLPEKELLRAKDELCSFLMKNLDMWGRSKSTIEEFCKKKSNPLEFLNHFDRPLIDNRNLKKEEIFEELKEKWERFRSEAEKYLNALKAKESSNFLKLFKLLKESYKLIVNREARLSFSDIANSVYGLLVRGWEPEEFYFRLDMRIRHLLIDEFQDTSFMQWLILKPIVDELLSGYGVKEEAGSFFYVGDKKQSIYRFRGAESDLFDIPLREYTDRIRLESLNKNRRSSKAIVEFINKLFNRMKELEFPYEQASATSQEDGYVEVKALLNDEEVLKAVKKAVKELIKRGKNPSEITILTRTNSDIDTIASYLQDESKEGYSIAVITETTSSVRHSEAGICVINLLKYLLERQKIHKETLKAYVEIEEEEFESGIKSLENSINTIPNSELLKTLLEKTALASAFKNDKNLLEIMELSLKLDNTDFHTFIVELERMMMDTPQASPQSQGGVRIMTTHKSKGLEFDTVIVPLLSYRMQGSYGVKLIRNEHTLKTEGFMVSLKKKMSIYSKNIARIIQTEEKKNLLDELNILYVALTRAKRELYLFGVTKYNRIAKITFDALKQEEGIKEDTFKLSYGRKTPILRKATHLKEEPASIRNKMHSGKKEEKREEIAGTLKERLFGEALHRTLEIARGFDKESIEKATEQVRLDYMLYLSEKDIKRIKEIALKLIDNQEFQRLIGEGRIEKEKSFLSKGSLKRIDLIVLSEKVVRVIDYKTSSDKNNASRYREQIEEYCRIASSVYSKPVEGYLIFLHDQIEIVKIFQSG